MVGAEIEIGLPAFQSAVSTMLRGSGQTQMSVESVGGDDHARIHAIVGIEDAFEFREGLDQFRREDLRQQFGARPSVAMLAGQRTAELGDQISDVLHRMAKLAHAIWRGKIEIDPAMDASVAKMAIEGGGLKPMCGQQAV